MPGLKLGRAGCAVVVTPYATSGRDETTAGRKPAMNGTPPTTGQRAVPLQPAQPKGRGTSDVPPFGEDSRVIRQEEAPAKPQ